jgi:hypothetical protein
MELLLGKGWFCPPFATHLARIGSIAATKLNFIQRGFFDEVLFLIDLLLRS